MSASGQPIELSIISPVYMGQHSVGELVDRIVQAVAPITDNYEIILVEDRSPDASWASIQKACESADKVVGIRLSRNFGQHYAITAGIEASHGRFVIVMDCDLQDDPAYIPGLYAKACEGFDVVLTRREERVHSFLKNLASKAYYRFMAWLTKTDSVKSMYRLGNYSIISRKVANAFISLNDYHRQFIPALFWLGFNLTFLDVKHAPRFEGRSSYSFMKLIALAINGIVAQSDRLLYLSITTGFAFVAVAMLGAGFLIVQYFLRGSVPGWPSVMVTLLLSAGLILMSLGILGMYLGKTFEQTKGRPLYIIDEIVRSDDSSANS